MNEILIPDISDKISKKLKELKLSPEISPEEFLQIHETKKHRYFSICRTKNGKKVIFFARLHNNLDAKKKFIKEANFLKKIKNSQVPIRKLIPEISGYGVEKDFEWLEREYLEALPLGHSENLFFQPPEKIIDDLVKAIIKISETLPQEISLNNLSKFKTEDYLPRGLYEDLTKRRIISSKLANKILKMIETSLRFLKEENHYFSHGDLNLGNILTDQKEIWIIDWELIHLNNFAYDIGYLWAHLWEAKKSFRKKLMGLYLKNLEPGEMEKFRKLFPIVVAFISLGGIYIKEPKLKTSKKRQRFYINLLKNCLNFDRLIKM